MTTKTDARARAEEASHAIARNIMSGLIERNVHPDCWGKYIHEQICTAILEAEARGAAKPRVVSEALLNLCRYFPEGIEARLHAFKKEGGFYNDRGAEDIAYLLDHLKLLATRANEVSAVTLPTEAEFEAWCESQRDNPPNARGAFMWIVGRINGSRSGQSG